MNDHFHMRITDVFHFQDGRTVLTGHVRNRSEFGKRTGPCDVLVDGKKVGRVQVYPEHPLRSGLQRDVDELEAVSTYDVTNLTAEIVRTHECCLEEAMQFAEVSSSV